MTGRRIDGFGVGQNTPEQVLAEQGIDGKADVYDLVAASRWKDHQGLGYLDKAELTEGARELAQKVAGDPNEINLGGYRANRAVFYKTKGGLITRLKKRVSNRQLIDASKPKDDGNKYLSEAELKKGAAGFERHEQRATEQQRGERIRFDKAPEVALTASAKKRDAFFDGVVTKAAAQLRALGHEVRLEGAREQKADMMAGRVPTMSYDADFGRDYRGEVYNTITVTTARGRTFMAGLGLLSSDQTYPGTDTKVYDRNVMLLNLDDEQKKYTGSGIDLSGRFGPGNNQRASMETIFAKEQELVDSVVGWFTNIIALNP